MLLQVGQIKNLSFDYIAISPTPNGNFTVNMHSTLPEKKISIVTQKNQLRVFSTLDSAYKMAASIYYANNVLSSTINLHIV